MKLFAVLGLLVGGYLYALMQTTNIVLGQTDHLKSTYQYVADHAEEIAAPWSADPEAAQ